MKCDGTRANITTIELSITDIANNLQPRQMLCSTSQVAHCSTCRLLIGEQEGHLPYKKSAPIIPKSAVSLTAQKLDQIGTLYLNEII